jgi:hypothetical protein
MTSRKEKILTRLGEMSEEDLVYLIACSVAYVNDQFQKEMSEQAKTKENDEWCNKMFGTDDEAKEMELHPWSCDEAAWDISEDRK